MNLKKHKGFIVHSFLSAIFILTLASLLFSCKQSKEHKNKNGEVRSERVTPAEVVLILKALGHVALEKNANLKVPKGSEWSTVSSKVKQKIKNYEKGWKEGAFQIEGGAHLAKDSKYKFEKDCTILILPQQEMISLIIRVDAGYTLKDAGKNVLSVGKYSTWATIKEIANSFITLNPDYDAVCWKKNGIEIKDEDVFEYDSLIEAVSRIKNEKDPDNVQIIILGDEGIEIAQDNVIIKPKGVTWSKIKEEAKAKIKTKNGYIFEDWHLNNKDGTLVQATHSFSEKTTVFAVSKKEQVEIYIKNVIHHTKKDSSMCKVDKNSKWQDIKDKALLKIEVNNNYKVVEWKLTNENGETLTDEFVFTKNEDILPICEKISITITVQADAGYTTSSDNKLVLANRFTWASIKERAIAKVNLKPDYNAREWRLESKDGQVLQDGHVFKNDSIVYATSQLKGQEKINITVKGDSGCVQKTESFTTLKGAKWSEIRDEASNHIELKNDNETKIIAWHIKDKTGEVLQENRVFENDATVFAVTAEKPVKLTISPDSGCHIVGSDNFIEVKKGATWSECKARAQAKIAITNPQYKKFDRWTLSSENSASEIAETHVFNNDCIIYAKTKSIQIKISIEGDIGLEVKDPCYIKVDKLAEWRNIKAEAEKMVKAKKYYHFTHWGLTKTEEVIPDNTTFSTDTKIYASSTRNQINVQVEKNGTGATVATNNILKVDAGTKWKEIKEKAQKLVSVEAGYKIVGWFESISCATPLSCDFIFEHDSSVACAKIEKEQITIKVQADGGFEVLDSSPISIEAGFNWGRGLHTIKEKVLQKIRLKEYYQERKFYLNSKTGSPLKDDYVFNEDATVVATSEREMIEVWVKADSGYTLKNGSHYQIPKGELWKNLKAEAMSRVELNSNYYEALDWYFYPNASGSELRLHDDQKVTEIGYFEATSRIKKIRIHIHVDSGFTQNGSASLRKNKGVLWRDVVAEAKASISLRNGYNETGWHLGAIDGALLKDDTKLEDGETHIYATSKPKTGIPYKVSHQAQRLDDPNSYDEFSLENKAGTAYEMTEAIALSKEGFIAQNITQKRIQPDGRTLVIIKYDRKEITLKLDLKGGKMHPALQEEGGYSLLKGKFGAAVAISAPEKEKHLFDKWEPPLPTHFPSSNPSNAYSAQWSETFAIKVIGDERIASPEVVVRVRKGAYSNISWSSIKNNVVSKLSLKPEWNKPNEPGYYGIYAFRLNSPTGEKLTDSHEIRNDITLYAITNFMKFSSADRNFINCLDSKGKRIKPRGKLIIPEDIEIIGYKAFEDCTEITAMDFSESKYIEKIFPYAFANCKWLKKLEGANFKRLEEIRDSAFEGCTGLEMLKFEEFPRLQRIGSSAFLGCTNLKEVSFGKGLQMIGEKAFMKASKTIVTLNFDVATIGSMAFGYSLGNRCAKVIVPNAEVKKKVKDTYYPEEYIEIK